MLYVENGPRGNCAWAWISLRLRLIIIQPKADTYFTAPRRVEDWFDVGIAEEYAVRAQGCISQLLSRQARAGFDRRTSLITWQSGMCVRLVEHSDLFACVSLDNQRSGFTLI